MKLSFGWMMLIALLVGVFIAPVLGVIIAIPPLLQKFRRPPKPLTSHGTARLADLQTVQRSGLLSAKGLMFGTAEMLPGFDRKRGEPAPLIRIEQFTHVATFAPTGRGKGVSQIIPNLLAYPKSVVVTDPKGENYKNVSAIRAQRFRHRQIRLDPFGICGSVGDSLNPLDFIDDEREDFLDQCRELANALVLRQGTETEPHWNDAAELVLCAFIAFVCAYENEPARRNLQTVRDLVSSRACFTEAIAAMQRVETHGGVIARLGGMLTWFQDKELGSVLTTVQRHTAFLDSPAVARCTSSSSFDPTILRTNWGASLYLCLPHNRLTSLAPLNRMWVGTLIRVLTRGRPTEENPVLFILDEIAHMGRLQAIEEAVTLMRGMGIRLWFIFQSLSQVRDCYGEHAATILDNIDTQQFFGTNSHFTAEEISKRMGETTIAVASHGNSSSQSKTLAQAFTPHQAPSVQQGLSTNWSETGRKLFKPEEIMALPEDVSLLFHRNVPVVITSLIKYYDPPIYPEFQLPSCLTVRRQKPGFRLPRLRRKRHLIPIVLSLMTLFCGGMLYDPFRLYMEEKFPVLKPIPNATKTQSVTPYKAWVPPTKSRYRTYRR